MFLDVLIYYRTSIEFEIARKFSKSSIDQVKVYILKNNKQWKYGLVLYLINL